MSSPRIIATPNGNTLEYNGRLLYSRYAPKKSALSSVHSLSIMSGTLVVVCSPALCYGLDELLFQLPDECFVAAIESCDELYSVARAHFPSDNRCALLNKKQVNSFVQSICRGGAQVAAASSGVDVQGKASYPQVRNAPCGGGWQFPRGKLRRCVRLDLSAGVQFDRAFYDNVVAACTDAIGRYWKNRATLIRFGRLYSRNLFRNIARLEHSTPLCDVVRSVARPILVAGAGESMEKTARQCAIMRGKVHIVAVDAAVGALLKLGIVPDDIVTEEAQSVIADAFVGVSNAVIGELPRSDTKEAIKAWCFESCGTQHCARKRMRAFLSLTGWSGAFDAVKDYAQAVYYATEYCPTRFLQGMKAAGVIPDCAEDTLLPPLGSVGLTAVRLAILLRRDENVPIFTAGLDFCYSVGTTHVRGAATCVKRLARATRLSPSEDYGASFGNGAVKADFGRGTAQEVSNKVAARQEPWGHRCANGANDTKDVSIKQAEKRTMPNLALYAALFYEQFSGVHNLFNAGAGGIPKISITDGIKETMHNETGGTLGNSGNKGADADIHRRVMAFYQKEKDALETLRALLIGSSGEGKDEVNKRIKEILLCREYLYLHFPDYTGEVCETLDTHFLRRVRSEADFFIKDIEIGMNMLDV